MEQLGETTKSRDLSLQSKAEAVPTPAFLGTELLSPDAKAGGGRWLPGEHGFVLGRSCRGALQTPWAQERRAGSQSK